MQYILSEEEYEKLVKSSKKVTSDGIEIINHLCRRIANTEHIPVYWDDKPQPWKCIRDEEEDEWYCDQCPVVDICKYRGKHFSK